MEKIPIILKDSPFFDAIKKNRASDLDSDKAGILIRNQADELCHNEQLLADLVNICFWTSIAVEEGRVVRGSICICSPADAIRSRPLNKPVPLSEKELVSLLTASPDSPLGVHLGENNTIEIWGFIDADPISRLKIRIAGSGTILATETNKEGVLAILHGGKVKIPDLADPYVFRILIAESLGLGSSKPIQERESLANGFFPIVAAIHKHGHGGALIVVPSTSEEWWENIELKYVFSKPGISVLQTGRTEYNDAWKTCEGIKKSTAHAHLIPMHEKSVEDIRNLQTTILKRIGDLSAIDGAVVVDEELMVYGFGAKITASNNSIGDFDVHTLDILGFVKGGTTCSGLGGTRHQSAARFVEHNHEAMVFVASQDGRLTLFCWVTKDNKVLAVRELEHLLWEYRELG